MKTLQQRTFSHACPIAQRLKKPFDKSRAHSFPGQSRWLNLSWKTRANSSALLILLPANEAMHVSLAKVWKLSQVMTSLERTVFRHNSIDGICPETPVPTALLF